MKIISIYELLGLVKDGKAPKKIYYEGETYSFINNGITNWYQNNRENDNSSFLDDVFRLKNFLNDEVEIIEEDKKIEKLNNKFTFEDNPSELSKTAWKISRISIKLNELIDEVNKLKEIEK